MARKKKSVAVEKFTSDRTLMERGEHTPIKVVDGITIYVNAYGTFVADAAGVEVHESTLGAAEEKVHRAFMRTQQKKRAKIGKPAYLYSPGRGLRTSGPWAKEGFFRGVHAGNGALQYRLPDGSKGSEEQLVVFPREHVRWPDLVNALKERRRLEELLDEQRKIINEITDAQRKRMYADVEVHGTYSHCPYIRNDADAAFEATRSIVKNVWGEDPFPEEGGDG